MLVVVIASIKEWRDGPALAPEISGLLVANWHCGRPDQKQGPSLVGYQNLEPGVKGTDKER